MEATITTATIPKNLLTVTALRTGPSLLLDPMNYYVFSRVRSIEGRVKRKLAAAFDCAVDYLLGRAYSNRKLKGVLYLERRGVAAGLPYYICRFAPDKEPQASSRDECAPQTPQRGDFTSSREEACGSTFALRYAADVIRQTGRRWSLIVLSSVQRKEEFRYSRKRRIPERTVIKSGRSAIVRKMTKTTGYLITLFLTLFILFTACSSPAADKAGAVNPGAKDKCPVCGMFVAKYPDFLARIVFKDGSVFFFDGAKDMFKFYFNVKKYSPRHKAEDIGSLSVTDYYDVAPMDGFKAFYVVGSDVYGPMGRELIPFAGEGKADEFKRDHKGKSRLRFKDVTPTVLQGLD